MKKHYPNGKNYLSRKTIELWGKAYYRAGLFCFFLSLLTFSSPLLLSQGQIFDSESTGWDAHARGYFESVRDDMEDFVALNKKSSPVNIPVYFTLLRNTDGTPYQGHWFNDLTQTEVDEMLDYLNEKFIGAGLQFYQLGDINYIDHDFARNAVYYFSDDGYVSAAANVYVAPHVSRSVAANPVGANDPEFFNNTITMQRLNSAYRKTAGHEFGHSFGLTHTFIGSPWIKESGQPVPEDQIDHPYAGDFDDPAHLNPDPRELVIRTHDENMPWYQEPNWFDAADMCEDTPACCRSGSMPDPDCTNTYPYTGEYKDYNEVLATPNVDNFMSYFSAAPDNVMKFTDCQNMFMQYVYLIFREEQYDNNNAHHFVGAIRLYVTGEILPGAFVRLHFDTQPPRLSNSLSTHDGKIQGMIYDRHKITANSFKPGSAEIESYIDHSETPPKVKFKTVYKSYWHDWVEGLSARDLYRINLHVNHNAPLSTGYQKLAADLNGDGVIDGNDIDLLDKLLKKEIESLDDFDHPWRIFPEFIPEEYSTSFHANPFEMIIQGQTVNKGLYTSPDFEFSLTPGQIANQAGYRSIKIGKVGWEGHLTIPMHTRKETNPPLNPFVSNGRIYKIKYSINGSQNITAWQASLGFDPEKFDIIGVLNESDTCCQPSYFIDTLSDKVNLHWYHDGNGHGSFSNDEIFSIYVSTKQTLGNLFDHLDIDTLFRPLLFFDDTLGVTNVRLNIAIDTFAYGALAPQVELKESPEKFSTVYPIPFGNAISVEVSRAAPSGKLSWRLISLEGKPLQSGQCVLTGGNNNIEINNLGSVPGGTYLLVLESDELREYHMVIKH